MFFTKPYYPWSNPDSIDAMAASQTLDPLTVFLNGACLRQYADVFKKLRVRHPAQLGAYRVLDLLHLGMTEAEINRLVGRMLDLEIPLGNLLEPTDAKCSHYNLELNAFDSDHRIKKDHPKFIRKLFKKRDVLHSSAPVSPAHRYQLFCGSSSDVLKPSTSILPLGIGDEDNLRSVTEDSMTTKASQPISRTPLTCLIPESDIKLHARIGVGSFGVVHRADWITPSGESLPVAVKLLRPEAMVGDHFTNFLDELRAMQCLSHPNLIRLYGVCLSSPILMVTELAPLGSLLLHLRAQSFRACSDISSSAVSPLPLVPLALQADSLWDMSVQIADGMNYLSSRGLVHRDLASRNILLSSVRRNEYPHIKIGDFGLVRTVQQRSVTAAKQSESKEIQQSCAIYQGHNEQKIPLAWSAPESLREHTFSQASDVWSWAVTCWEMWTSGAVPWPSMDSDQLLRAFDSGRRLTWPRSICPRKLYQLMLACWRTDPGQRPTFSYLAQRLDTIRPFTTVATQTFDEADHLGLDSGDVIVVIECKPDAFWWRGQNRRTGEVGSFPRGIVRLENVPPSEVTVPTNLSTRHSDQRESLNRVSNCSSLLANRMNSRRYSRSAYSHKFSSDATQNDNLANETLWHPLREFLGTDSLNESLGPRSDDSYSIVSTDRPVDAPPTLDHYDDEEDERCMLDRMPDARIGSANAISSANLSNFARSQLFSSMATKNKTLPDLYSFTTSLPPPPGPVEYFASVADENGRDVPPEPPRQSATTSASGAPQHTTRSQPDTTPPLIDFHTVFQRPMPNRTYAFPIPSAPIYQSSVPGCFPVRRFQGYGFPMSHSHFVPHNVSPQVSSHIPVPNNQTWTSFSAAAAAASVSGDPFELDALLKSIPDPNTPNDESRATTPTPDQCQPPSTNRVHMEKQLLQGAASSHPTLPTTTQQAKLPDQPTCPAPNVQTILESREPCFHVSPSQSSPQSPRNSRMLFEVRCIQSQLPSCTEEEARRALSYLLNPFIFLPPHLIVPPPQTSSFTPDTRLPSESSSQIQLAIRVVLAHRLLQLGIADMETCCEALSLNRWNSSLATVWLLNRQTAKV